MGHLHHITGSGWIIQLGSIETIRDSRWTKSIAVGSNPFVKRIKSAMGTMAKGRKIQDYKDGLELREETVAYNAVLGPENCDIAQNMIGFDPD